MFDMSWGEVLVIGAVALIVIGPKDLPKALRTVGKMTSQVRKMAGEFQSQFNEAMREAELDEIKKTVSGLNDSVSSLNTSFNPIQTVRDELKSAIESAPPQAHAVTGAPTAPEPAAPAHDGTAGSVGAPLPGEPAFDLALPPTPPPVEVETATRPTPLAEPAAASGAAEGQKA